jgi:hypothetical protein
MKIPTPHPEEWFRCHAASHHRSEMKPQVRDDLAAVLPGLADLPIQRLPELTPAPWVAQRS